MKRRHENFVNALVRAVALNEGKVDDDQLIKAYRAAFSFGAAEGTDNEQKVRALALIRAKALLQLTDIREALRELYEFADFDVLEAAALHVKHIRGGIPTEKIFCSKDGKVTRVKTKMPPNYDALKDYIRVALPQPAVKVDKRVMVGHLHARGTPEILARVITEDDDVEASVLEA